MPKHTISGHRRLRRWPAQPGLLRSRSTPARMIAAGIGALLMLAPVEVLWPQPVIADSLVSGAALDWVKGSIGLFFYLRRRLNSGRGVRR